jgi:RecA-family ATPase
MAVSRDYDALADALDRETQAAGLPPLEVYGEDDQPRRRPNGKGLHGPAEDIVLASPGAALEWEGLVGREPPERQWIVPHWIPAGHVTLLSGRGGVGKSLLAQHLGTAIAAGSPYLENLTPRSVLMWAAEDDYDELWRRQINISSYLGAPLENLGNFRLRSCVGCDVTLAAPAFNALAPTPLLQTLKAECKEHGAELVIIDNVARVFGGNENDRHQVTTFIAWLQAACAPAAVLLLGHPAKAVGSEFSGSTAWEGAVRARLYFSDRPPDEKAAEDEFSADEQVRYLSRRKANYSELDMRKLNLRDGVLMPEEVRRAVSRPALSRDTVLRAVGKLAEKQIFGTSSTASPNYLPKLAKQYSLLDSITESAFAAAMRQLVMSGELISAKVGAYPNRTPKMGLAIPAQMQRPNG